MQKAENQALTRAITNLVSNALVTGEEVEQVVYHGGSLLHLTHFSPVSHFYTP